MIRKITVYSIGILLFLGLILATPALARAVRPVDNTLDSFESDGYSGAILIAHHGEIVHQRASGFASCAQSSPNSTDTVFSIGSIAKMFTATAIGQLDDQGIINIDHSLDRYFDQLPPDKANITIRQLLDHSAGLETYHETERRGDFESMSQSKAFTEITNRPLLFEPGSGENYSNSGYTLLALLIEEATGQSYVDYVHDSIFVPAGMHSTGFWGNADLKPIASTPNEVLGCSSPDQWEYSWVIVGNGGMVSTVGDLHRWLLALQGDAVLSQNAKERLGFDRIMRIGFGDAGGSSQHEFNAAMSYFAPNDMLVVAISNRDTVRAESVSGQLLFSALFDAWLGRF